MGTILPKNGRIGHYIFHYALYGILPDSHLRVWEIFVIACRLLCQPVLTKQEFMKADALLVKFCTGMEKLYGKQFLTCKMHLHCHLHSVVLDYGPVLGFWFFSFERYKGQLGSILTNNHSVENQFMRDFFKERFLTPSAGNLPTIPRGNYANLQQVERKKDHIIDRRLSATVVLIVSTDQLCKCFVV